jgi:hypothetical protein
MGIGTGDENFVAGAQYLTRRRRQRNRGDAAKKREIGDSDALFVRTGNEQPAEIAPRQFALASREQGGCEQGTSGQAPG